LILESTGANIAKDKDILPGAIPGDLHSRLIQLLDAILAVFSYPHCIRAKRIGQDDLSASLDIRTMNGLDLVGMGNVPRIRRLPTAKASPLQFSAHRSITDENSRT
jgi:hypothetical protein